MDPQAHHSTSSPPRAKQGRWTDALTVVALTIAVLAVLMSAVPSLLDAAGLPRNHAAERDIEVPHTRGILDGDPHLPAVIADEGDDEDPVDDLQRLYPEPGNWPGMREPGADEAPPAAGGMRVAAALKPIQLVDKPGKAAAVTGELQRGDVVRIVKQEGDWALVLKSGGDGIAMGWSRLSELAIR